jgi:hypothetical protein
MSDPVCFHCGEGFQTGRAAEFMGLTRDEHVIVVLTGATSVAIHKVCLFRAVTGGVAHHEKRCGCYVPGAEHTDPEGMSKLEAAQAALAAFRKAHGISGEA